MSAINSTTLEARRERMRAALKKKKKPAQKQQKLMSNKSVSMSGVLLKKYQTERQDYEATIVVLDPTSCFKNSTSVTDKDTTIAEVDKESGNLILHVVQNKNFKERLVAYKAAGYQVEIPFNTLVPITPMSVIKPKFKPDLSGLSVPSPVNFSVSTSAWIGECQGEADPSDNVRRAMKFLNGNTISLAREVSSEEMFATFKKLSQLCTTKLPTFKEMCEQEEWDPQGMRKKSHQVLFIPVSADEESDFAWNFKAVSEEGAGCVAVAKKDTTVDNAFLHKNKEDQTMSVFKFVIEFSQHDSEEQFTNGQEKDFQLSGIIWDTNAMGMSDTRVWEVMAPRITSSVDMILPAQVNLERSSLAPENQTPGNDGIWGKFVLDVMSPMINLAGFLHSSTLPVSEDFVRAVVNEEMCFMGTPSQKTVATEQPLVRCISEMNPQYAKDFMNSDRCKDYFFRALTAVPFNKKQKKLVSDFIENHEDKEIPGLEGLLDPDWNCEPDETRTALYGETADATDPMLTYTEEHPIMKESVSAAVTMANVMDGKVLYYLYAIDRKQWEELQSGKADATDVLSLPACMTQKTIAPPPAEKEGSPKRSADEMTNPEDSESEAKKQRTEEQ